MQSVGSIGRNKQSEPLKQRWEPCAKIAGLTVLLVGIIAAAVSAQRYFFPQRQMNALSTPLETGFEDPSALFKAIPSADDEAAKILIQNGADIEPLQSGKSLLRWAAEKKRWDIVRSLIQAGADPFSTDSNGDSDYNYLRGAKGLKILTGTEEHPAFAACDSALEFFDILFPPVNGDASPFNSAEFPVLTELEKEERRLKENGIFGTWQEIPLTELKEKEDALPSVLHFLKEKNPLFAIAWREANRYQPIQFTDRGHLYDSEDHSITLHSHQRTGEMVERLCHLIIYALFRELESDLRVLGKYSREEYAHKNFAMDNTVAYWGNKLGHSDPANVIHKIFDSSLAIYRNEWYLKHSGAYLKTHKKEIAERVAQLAEPSLLNAT